MIFKMALVKNTVRIPHMLGVHVHPGIVPSRFKDFKA